MAGRRMDVVVGWVLAGDVGPQVVERTQELLGEGALDFWRPDLAVDRGPRGSLPDQTMSPRVRQSSKRRLWAQRDLSASRLTLPDASRRRSP